MLMRLFTLHYVAHCTLCDWCNSTSTFWVIVLGHILLFVPFVLFKMKAASFSFAPILSALVVHAEWLFTCRDSSLHRFKNSMHTFTDKHICTATYSLSALCHCYSQYHPRAHSQVTVIPIIYHLLCHSCNCHHAHSQISSFLDIHWQRSIALRAPSSAAPSDCFPMFAAHCLLWVSGCGVPRTHFSSSSKERFGPCCLQAGTAALLLPQSPILHTFRGTWRCVLLSSLMDFHNGTTYRRPVSSKTLRACGFSLMHGSSGTRWVKINQVRWHRSTWICSQHEHEHRPICSTSVKSIPIYQEQELAVQMSCDISHGHLGLPSVQWRAVAFEIVKLVHLKACQTSELHRRLAIPVCDDQTMAVNTLTTQHLCCQVDKLLLETQ